MKREEEHETEADISFESQFYEKFSNGQELADRSSITKANCKEFLSQKFSVSSFLSKINISTLSHYNRKVETCNELANEANKYKNMLDIINRETQEVKVQIEYLDKAIEESETQLERLKEDEKKLTKEVKSLNLALSLGLEVYAKNFDFTVNVDDSSNICKASIYFGSNQETLPVVLHVDPIKRKIVDLEINTEILEAERQELKRKTNNFELTSCLGVLLRELYIFKLKKS